MPSTSSYYIKFPAFCKGSAVFQTALGPPAGKTCLVLRTKYREMRPTDYRENCLTVPEKSGNILSTLVFSLWERDVNGLRGRR